MSDDDFDNLALKYLDGGLSPDELTCVNEHLRSNADARMRLNEIALQATALADIARMRAPALSAFPSTQPAAIRSRRIWFISGVAALLALVASVMFLNSENRNSGVVLVECVGGANWYGPTGESKPGLITGVHLNDGTLSLDGETSSAQIRFDDGTLITLGGVTELVYASSGQKRLDLKTGTMTASVTPQPRGRPMRIRTPMAEVEVLGTVLDLTARNDQTLLNVEKGLVMLRRLADGKEIQVTANSAAMASLDTNASLLVTKREESPVKWQRVFGSPPDENWKGVWHAPERNSPGFVSAVPYVAGRKPDGRIITHFGIAARTFSKTTGQPAVLGTDASNLHLRWRTQKPAAIQIMLLTQKPSGGFGGNFEYKFDGKDYPPDADGWREARIALSDFEARTPRTASQPSGTRILTVLLSSFTTDVKLEVAEIGIANP